MPLVVSTDAIEQLRHWQGIRCGTSSDKALARVIVMFDGDVDLAATALKMDPRPAWVSTVLDAAPE